MRLRDLWELDYILFDYNCHNSFRFVFFFFNFELPVGFEQQLA